MRKLIPYLCAMSALSAQQVEPGAGQWKTWVIPSGAAMRLPAPGDPASEAAAVKLAASQRTANDLAMIAYWDSGAPAYRWMQLATQAVAGSTLAGPQQTRALALVATAISDATIAAWDSKYAYNRVHPTDLDKTIPAAVVVPQSPSYPSEHAATAAAAATVLSYLFPDQATKFTQAAQQAANSRLSAGVAFPSDLTAGTTLGTNVGNAVIAYAKRDASDQVFTGSYPPAPGVWGSANPVTPLAGTWVPWVLAQGSEFRPAAPPPFGSDAANAQYTTATTLVRTNTTNHLAWFWQPNFFQTWLQQVDLEMFQNHLDLNPPRAARAYAYETTAQHDATLACWDTKYTYLEPRPSQAVPSFTPVFAIPQHPGYPSGHACASAASAAVLSSLFPIDAAMFAQMANDAGFSTFDAGIHTQLDVNTGLTLGKLVGTKVAARAQSDGANPR